jgi:hypothetical protein
VNLDLAEATPCNVSILDQGTEREAEESLSLVNFEKDSCFGDEKHHGSNSNINNIQEELPLPESQIRVSALCQGQSTDMTPLEDDEQALEKVVEEVITLETEEEDRRALEMNAALSSQSRRLPFQEPPGIPDAKVQGSIESSKHSPAPPTTTVNLSKTKSWSCLTCSEVFEDVQDYEGKVLNLLDTIRI